MEPMPQMNTGMESMQMNTQPRHQSSQTETNSWSHSLFSLKDPCTLILAFLCPCIVYAQNRQTLTAQNGCLADCALYCCMASCGCCSCIGASTRAEIRKEFRIKGSWCLDVTVHCCCSPCALNQEKLQLDD